MPGTKLSPWFTFPQIFFGAFSFGRCFTLQPNLNSLLSPYLSCNTWPWLPLNSSSHTFRSHRVWSGHSSTCCFHPLLPQMGSRMRSCRRQSPTRLHQRKPRKNACGWAVTLEYERQTCYITELQKEHTKAICYCHGSRWRPATCAEHWAQIPQRKTNGKGLKARMSRRQIALIIPNDWTDGIQERDREKRLIELNQLEFAQLSSYIWRLASTVIKRHN